MVNPTPCCHHHRADPPRARHRTHHRTRQGNDITTNSSYGANRWFTPAKGSTSGYQPSFQDYSEIAAYAIVKYTDTTRSAATVTVVAESKVCVIGVPACLQHLCNIG